MKFSIILGIILTTACVTESHSHETTDPVGFIKVKVPAQSDCILAVPLNRPATFKGMVASKSGTTITVKGTPGWANSRFVFNGTTQQDTFAARIASGVKEGLVAKITASDADTLTLELDAGESLVEIVGDTDDGELDADGDHIDIVPYWTPATLFGSGLPTGTEMYVFDNTTPGTNTSPTLLLQYFSGFGWYETINFTIQSHRPLLFGTGFILRNNTSSPISAAMTGDTPMVQHRIVLRTLAANRSQDQTIGYLSPVPEKLSELNLGAKDNDELYIFDNSASGKNKSPSQPLILANGRWYNSLTFTDVTDSVVVKPGDAMIYRMGQTPSPQSFIWTHLQSYLSNIR